MGKFFRAFNFKIFFLEEACTSSETLRFYTDAAKSSAFGIVFGTCRTFGEWPESWKKMDISFLELYPIVLGLHIWCRELRNKRVLFFSDNDSAVQVINKQTAKETNLLALVRNLVLTCLQNNIVFRAKHIKEKRNVLADSLSRLQVEKFKALSQGMNRTATPIPSVLLPANWE